MELFEPGLCFGILFFLLLSWMFLRRHMCISRIRRMPKQEKLRLLEKLAAPFGFTYEPAQDVFSARIDAWQRREGYEMLFDRLASKFHMILDACPIYFDYRGKTWLIEVWKGQYGIHTGAEIGIYHTNRLVPKNQREKVHYNAISDEEMPQIGMYLTRRGKKLCSAKKYHWWLAAFRMGTFSNPGDLVLHMSIMFRDREAAQAFRQGLADAHIPSCRYRVKNRRATVLFDASECRTGMRRLHEKGVQFLNGLFCILYRILTRPFTETPDRILFLYEQLPICLRQMLRLRSFGRKNRAKMPM